MKGVVKGIIIGLVIMAIGVAVLVSALALNGWKFSDGVTYNMETFEQTNDVKAINIDLQYGSVKTEFYDGDKIRIEYPAADSLKLRAAEENGTITLTQSTKWYYFISRFGTGDIPDTVVKFPESDATAYDLFIHVNAGSVNLAGAVYGEVKIDVDAGKFKTESLQCTSFFCDIDAGNVEIGELISEKTTIDVDAGNIDIKKLDCDKNILTIDAGNLTLGMPYAKYEYVITIDQDVGNCNVSEQKGPGARSLNIDVDCGNISVSFAG